MNTRHHRNHKHSQHLHRAPDAYELYELEHMPYELIKAPSDRLIPQPRQIDDSYETGIEVQPHWRPLAGEGVNGVIFRPDYYKPKRSMQPYPRSKQRDEEGGCNGDVDCEAEKFIESEHEKFELISKWMSTKK